MRQLQIVLFSLVSTVLFACGDRGETNRLEEHKVLARQFFQDLDNAGTSVDFIDRWMTPDFRTYFNSSEPMDLAGYRQFMSGALNAFSDMRHDIHYVIAENDRVAMFITLRMVHTGDFNGVPATGRSVAIEEFVVVRFADGKIAEEWVVVDFAALQQQLTAPTPGT